jgi:hypothetical protein
MVFKNNHSGYDYIIKHHSGQEHVNADTMSRLMCKWDLVDDLLIYWIKNKQKIYIIIENCVSNDEIPLFTSIIPPHTPIAIM